MKGEKVHAREERCKNQSKNTCLRCVNWNGMNESKTKITTTTTTTVTVTNAYRRYGKSAIATRKTNFGYKRKNAMTSEKNWVKKKKSEATTRNCMREN